MARDRLKTRFIWNRVITLSQLDFADAAHMQFSPLLVSKKITIHVK